MRIWGSKQCVQKIVTMLLLRCTLCVLHTFTLPHTHYSSITLVLLLHYSCITMALLWHRSGITLALLERRVWLTWMRYLTVLSAILYSCHSGTDSPFLAQRESTCRLCDAHTDSLQSDFKVIKGCVLRNNLVAIVIIIVSLCVCVCVNHCQF